MHLHRSFRSAFTLIELMIVIAIIAIIAAIAIPNLLESRITANEAGAATSLKSGLFPAQTQFQAGAYSDLDNNGRGEYCSAIRYMAGADSTDPVFNAGWTGMSWKKLSLLPPVYNQNVGAEMAANTGAFSFAVVVQGPDHVDWAENYWAGWAKPNSPGSDGRRAFSIHVGGRVIATKGTVTDAQLATMAGVYGANGMFMWAGCPWQSMPDLNPTNAVPYNK